MIPHDVVIIRRGDPADSPSPVTIHGLPAWESLANKLERDGHRLVVGLERASGERPALFLWDFGSVARLPKSTLAHAQGKVIAWCLESPLVAHRAFHRLNAIAQESTRIMTFEGARNLLHGDLVDRFAPIMYPIRKYPEDWHVEWEQRTFLTMINSNKSVTPGLGALDLSHPIRAARTAAASVLARSYSVQGRWSLPDQYAKRVDALAYFADHDDFDLYGSGWRGAIPGLSLKRRRALEARYRGVAADKLAVLAQYRFCLCFENTAFPGYITEKIFDCFFAGTIPIYLGAPDIDSYVPKECFIDASAMDMEEIADFASGTTPARAMEYLDAAQRFLHSDRFEPFTEEKFIQSMGAAVELVAA